MKRGAWAALLGLTGLAVGLYLLGLPGLRDITQWFYQPRDKGIAAPLAAVLLALALPLGLGAAVALGRRARFAAATALLVACGYAAQLGLTLAGGTAELWERHALGHSEFFRIAASRRGTLLETLRNYDDLTWDRKLGSFAYTKPPGTYATYAILIWLGDQEPIKALLAPLADSARTDPRVADHAEAAAVSTVLMPLGAALTVVPLVLLGIALFGRRPEVVHAAVFWVTCPSVLLITYHLDDSLFPILGTGACALAAYGARRSSHTASVAAGALLSLGLYASFSLLPVIGLVVGIYVLVLVDDRVKSSGWRAASYWLGWHLLAVCAGFVAVLFTLEVALGFDLSERVKVALDTHRWWKRGVPTTMWRFLGAVEFALYAGLPLFCAFVARGVTGAVALIRRRAFAFEDAASAVLVLYFVALCAKEGTNEVARMWIFFVPFVCLAAALYVSRLVPSGTTDRRADLPVLAVALCQAVIAIVMKGLQGW